MVKKHLLRAGVLCLLASFLLVLVLSIPTLGGGQTVRFASRYKDSPVTLEGSYRQGDNGYAVLICPGYSCDRQKWRPFANVFVKNGFSTMTFDYSGQGASSGTIGFDNAKTDAIPVQIDDAIEELHRLSGVDYDRIVLVGHSMGGRAILRLLDDYHDPNADTTLTRREIQNVILMSPEVNYHFNAQASLFAGTSDETEEPWKSLSPACIGSTNVYLFGSTADDIVADEDVWAVFARLGGSGAESGMGRAEAETENGSKLRIQVTNGLLHSYMMYSPKAVRFVDEALTEICGFSGAYPAWKIGLVYWGWILGLIGLLLTVIGLSNPQSKQEEPLPKLTDARRFLLFKTLMWLPGTLAAGVICCLCVIMPFGSPVMNIPYMCFIAGFGLVMALAYRRGCFPGTSGKLPKPSLSVRKQGMAATFLTLAVLCFYVWFVLRMTMYRLIPLNARLFWVLFAAILMGIGYYVSGCESDMLHRAGAGKGIILGYNLLQYVPLFLLVGFYLMLKSYSGMIGQMQNMLLMYLFCVPMGSFLSSRTGSRLWGALTSAFLFQTLMITSAALIAIF